MNLEGDPGMLAWFKSSAWNSINYTCYLQNRIILTNVQTPLSLISMPTNVLSHSFIHDSIGKHVYIGKLQSECILSDLTISESQENLINIML